MKTSKYGYNIQKVIILKLNTSQLRIIRGVILMLLLYIVQFLLFPQIFPNYYRISNEATTLYWISFAFVVFVGAWSGLKSIIDWLPGNLWYLVCIGVYSANGAYNAQLDEHYKIKLILLTALIYMLELVVFQFIIIKLVNVVHKTFKK